MLSELIVVPFIKLQLRNLSHAFRIELNESNLYSVDSVFHNESIDIYIYSESQLVSR